MFRKGRIFGLGTPVEINVSFEGEERRKKVDIVRSDQDVGEQKSSLPQFTHGETIKGKVTVSTPHGSKIEYQEAKIELIGTVTVSIDSPEVTEFLTVHEILDGAGVVEETKTFDFSFADAELPYESYEGNHANLVYKLRVTIIRGYAPNVVENQEIWVHRTEEEADPGGSIRMEVGIENCLHIQFEYNKARYHLEDVVLGKIYFLKARIPIKTMEIAIVRRETIGIGSTVYNDTHTVTKFEVMDGAPVRGETVPVRLFLASVRLTPTFNSICKRFSVKYYLNLVIVDTEDRRYYKQQEIGLWRRDL